MVIDLKDKVGIVTGAGAGIGREIARTLVREGVRLVAVDRDEAALDGLIAEIGGDAGIAVPCDLTDEAQIPRVVEEATRRYGRIDILVNNAGVAVGGPVETLPVERWDLNFNVNTRGMFLMCQAVVPTMKARRYGRIINAASFAAIIPSIGGAAYAASKAAVTSFTRVLAGELGPYEITVNAYAPGMIPTGMNHFADLPQEKKDALLDSLTLRRWGSPADVANLVCFLASDLSSYITGTLIDVSGGKFATQRPYSVYRD